VAGGVGGRQLGLQCDGEWHGSCSALQTDPMTPDQIAAFLPALAAWMAAGLATGWLVALLAQGSGGQR
jgi:hypothetical protein